jgi:hypothetical protein
LFTFGLLAMFIEIRNICIFEEVKIFRSVVQKFSGQSFVQFVLAGRTKSDALKSDNGNCKIKYFTKIDFRETERQRERQ